MNNSQVDEKQEKISKACNLAIMFLVGQTCAFLVALSSVCVTHLKKYSLELPFSMNLIPFLFIGLFTTPSAVYRIFHERNLKEFWTYFKSYGFIYLIIAICEVSNNWAITSAYYMTNLVSVQSLTSFAVFSGLLLSRLIFRLKYIYTHYIGLLICILGYIMMIIADYKHGSRTDRETSPTNKHYIFSQKADIIIGDLLTIFGSVCYGISLTLQEFIIRKDGFIVNLGTYSLMACITMVPFIVGFERTEIYLAVKNVEFYPGSVGWAFFSYAAIIVAISILVNFFLNRWNSVYLNLSLLTTNFYALIMATLIFHEKFTPLYFFSFCIIAFGCIIFSLVKPEKKSVEK